jgi:hypothetical protein
MISSVETSLNGHIRSRNVAPIDPQTPGPCYTHGGHDHSMRGENMSQSDSLPPLPDKRPDVAVQTTPAHYVYQHYVCLDHFLPG